MVLIELGLCGMIDSVEVEVEVVVVVVVVVVACWLDSCCSSCFRFFLTVELNSLNWTMMVMAWLVVCKNECRRNRRKRSWWGEGGREEVDGQEGVEGKEWLL
jgi:hypothetical protein